MKFHKLKAKWAGWYDGALNGPVSKDKLPADHKKKGYRYFRSGLEVEYARNLQIRLAAKDIKSWAFEPESWDFQAREKKVLRRNSLYTPDFMFVDSKGETYFVEAKGFNYSGSATKIRRALKYFPERKLLVYTKKTGTIAAQQYLDKIKSESEARKRIKALRTK